jgi:hypothetical protein
MMIEKDAKKQNLVVPSIYNRSGSGQINCMGVFEFIAFFIYFYAPTNKNYLQILPYLSKFQWQTIISNKGYVFAHSVSRIK